MPQTLIDTRTEYVLTYTTENDWEGLAFWEAEVLAMERDREAADVLAQDAKRVLIAQL
jgi:hypothetical protein